MTIVGIIKEHGCTVKEIAQKLGINTRTIYYWNREGIVKSNKYYPTLKEMFPELEGRESYRQIGLYLPTPLPTREELKILEE